MFVRRVIKQKLVRFVMQQSIVEWEVFVQKMFQEKSIHLVKQTVLVFKVKIKPWMPELYTALTDIADQDVKFQPRLPVAMDSLPETSNVIVVRQRILAHCQQQAGQNLVENVTLRMEPIPQREKIVRPSVRRLVQCVEIRL